MVLLTLLRRTLASSP